MPPTWYRTQRNYDYRETYRTSDRGVSMTDPSQHMSVQEIFQRFTRNIGGVPRNNLANFDQDMSMFDQMNNLERQQALMTLRSRVTVLRKHRDDLNAQAKAKADAARFEEEKLLFHESKLKELARRSSE